MSKFIPHLAFMKTGSVKVTVKGQDALNRALNGDKVAVELLPPSRWYYPKKDVGEPNE